MVRTSTPSHPLALGGLAALLAVIIWMLTASMTVVLIAWVIPRVSQHLARGSLPEWSPLLIVGILAALAIRRMLAIQLSFMIPGALVERRVADMPGPAPVRVLDCVPALASAIVRIGSIILCLRASAGMAENAQLYVSAVLVVTGIATAARAIGDSVSWVLERCASLRLNTLYWPAADTATSAACLTGAALLTGTSLVINLGSYAAAVCIAVAVARRFLGDNRHSPGLLETVFPRFDPAPPLRRQRPRARRRGGLPLPD